MMKSTLPISVIVCTYQRERYLKNCLRGLSEQSCPVGRYELLVIDNAVREETSRVVADISMEYPEVSVRYIAEGTAGLSYARNRGIAEAYGDSLIFLDDDVIPDPSLVEEYEKAFKDWPEVWAIAGRIELFWENGRPEHYPEEWELLLAKLDYGQEPKQLEPPEEVIIGANMAFRKEAFSQIGQFNVNLGFKGGGKIGGEEIEIFQRIHYAGGVVRYLPTAMVKHIVHPDQLTISALRKRALGMGRERIFREKYFISGKEIDQPARIAEELRWLARNYKYPLKRLLRREISLDEEISYYKHLGILEEKILLMLNSGRPQNRYRRL